MPDLKVLAVSASVLRPPLVDGYSLQLHHLLAGLTGYELRLLAVGEPEGDWIPEHVRFRGIPPSGRSAPGRFHHRALVTPLAEELHSYRPDVVHVAGNSLASLVGVSEGRVPTVLAALDAPFLNVHAGHASALGRIRRRLKMEWMKRYVRRLYRRFDRVVVVSDEDGRALTELDPAIRTTVIPNGVDVAAFAMAPFEDRNEDELVFTGALKYGPNEDAAVFLAREVLPLVRRSRPSATLRIVGRAPGPVVRALDVLEGVTVVGEVPEMQPELSRSSVYVCPMISGTGIKNKLLEAMANGLPCVATPLATRGLEVRSGHHLMVADTAGALAGAVVGLLADGESRRCMGQAGRDYVRDNHSWSKMARSYAALYEEVRHGLAGGQAAT